MAASEINLTLLLDSWVSWHFPPMPPCLSRGLLWNLDGIWGDTIKWVITADETLLSANKVIITFKEQGSTKVIIRKLVKHRLPHHPWEVQFWLLSQCEDSKTPYGFYVPNNKWNMKVKWRGCGWKLVWVKEKQWGKHCLRSSNRLANILWHAYLPLQALQWLFANAAQSMPITPCYLYHSLRHK